MATKVQEVAPFFKWRGSIYVFYLSAIVFVKCGGCVDVGCVCLELMVVSFVISKDSVSASGFFMEKATSLHLSTKMGDFFSNVRVDRFVRKTAIVVFPPCRPLNHLCVCNLSLPFWRILSILIPIFFEISPKFVFLYNAFFHLDAYVIFLAASTHCFSGFPPQIILTNVQPKTRTQTAALRVAVLFLALLILFFWPRVVEPPIYISKWPNSLLVHQPFC